MKFSLTYLLATLSLTFAFVNAAPLRIVAISSSAQTFRLGHAAAGAASPPRAEMITTISSIPHKDRMRGGCHSKAVQMTNWFRQSLGLPIIPTVERINNPGDPGPRYGGAIPTVMPIEHLPHMRGGPYHKYPQFHHHRGFWSRVHHALMVLGPWEGRAVAFVLGCGIGSLIRMIWVLSTLLVRSFTSSENENAIVLDEEETDDQPAPPVYPVEKVPILVVA